MGSVRGEESSKVGQIEGERGRGRKRAKWKEGGTLGRGRECVRDRECTCEDVISVDPLLLVFEVPSLRVQLQKPASMHVSVCAHTAHMLAYVHPRSSGFDSVHSTGHLGAQRQSSASLPSPGRQ